jgi:hypothetical protein
MAKSSKTKKKELSLGLVSNMEPGPNLVPFFEKKSRILTSFQFWNQVRGWFNFWKKYELTLTQLQFLEKI